MEISRVKLGIQWFLLFFGSYSYGSSWNVLMTHPLYADVRMIIDEESYYNQRNIPKVFSELDARFHCIQDCALDPKCITVQFCNNEGNFYVCELLLNNICQRDNVTIFEASPGCAVWEKLPTGIKECCVQKKYGKIIQKPCDMFMPGCWGTWPNCQCSKTCAEWQVNLWTPYRSMSDGQRGTPPKIYIYIFMTLLLERFTTFLRPDGNLTSVPILARCYIFGTILFWRQIEASTGRILHDYRMDFSDAKRIQYLTANKRLDFAFLLNNSWRYFFYLNLLLHANGSLTNLVYSGFGSDILNLTISSRQTLPFVTVNDDIYGCGSFWLLDPTNATYCPGGTLGMLGTFRMNGSTIVSTGIRFPNVAVPISEALIYFH